MYSTNRADRGFTLLEILLSVAILGLVTVVAATGFSAAAQVWRRSTTLSENLHHADFLLDQLVMGLRSAYYPSLGQVAPDYGFVHEDDGDGPYARDAISWVKLGSALLDTGARFAESPHRVRFFIDDAPRDGRVAAVTAWQLIGQPDDFDPEDLEPTPLSRRVTGFTVRSAFEADEAGELDWLDTWEETNRVPRVVALTLFLEPLEAGEAPMPVRRIVEIPAGALSW